MFAFRQCIGFLFFAWPCWQKPTACPLTCPKQSELVSGYCTEYSGMRYALFFMAEYTSMFVMATVGQ